MPFGSVAATPEQLDIMKQALLEHCAENGIPSDSEDFAKVAVRIVFLFGAGTAGLDELKAGLAGRTVPPVGSPRGG